MALGPGKYDALCTYVRETAKAEGAAIIVWGAPGEKGAGFSVQCTPPLLLTLPDVLRNMADTLQGHQKDPLPGDGIN
jgi:hypothetical protein